MKKLVAKKQKKPQTEQIKADERLNGILRYIGADFILSWLENELKVEQQYLVEDVDFYFKDTEEIKKNLKFLKEKDLINEEKRLLKMCLSAKEKLEKKVKLTRKLLSDFQNFSKAYKEMNSINAI